MQQTGIERSLTNYNSSAMKESSDNLRLFVTLHAPGLQACYHPTRSMQKEFAAKKWEIENNTLYHARECSEYYFIWRINNPVYRVQYGEGYWEVNPGVFVHSIRRL